MTALKLVRLLALALAFAFGLLAAPAIGATPTLRPRVVVEAPVLRIVDLFDNAGPAGARVIARAPAPGQRLTLDAGDLARLARTHGLAWRPASVADHALVERPGAPVPRAAIEAALRAVLAARRSPGSQDAPDQADEEIELPGLGAIQVPIGVPAQVTALDAALDPASGRFIATLLVAAEGMTPTRQRVSGRLHPILLVPAAAHRLAAGHVVGAADVRPVRIRRDRMQPGLVTEARAVLGQALRRPLAEGSLFVLRDLMRPIVVPRGSAVIMMLETAGLSIAATGRALEDGAQGQVIRVANSQSRIELDAEVVGPGRVRVAMPSPLPLATGTGAPPGRDRGAPLASAAPAR